MMKRKFLVSLLLAFSFLITTVAPSFAATTSSTQSDSFKLPPGVTINKNIKPVAPLTASRDKKAEAVLKVAVSKLGTPYRWGHNEDRGQFGFDCSNFTAYVYNHALGYKISTASKTQNSKVGWKVSKSNMQKGDLIIFDNGKHVGIYAGNNKVIQCGGGLKKVGYLSVAPGSYWGKHITSVRRMF